MKKKSPLFIVALMAIWAVASLLFPPESKTDSVMTPDIYGFAKLPVLLDGRIQPIDSSARNAMKVIRH